MLLKHTEHFYPHPSFLSDSVSFNSLMILMHHHFPLFALSPAVCHKPAMPEGDKDTSYDKGKKIPSPGTPWLQEVHWHDLNKRQEWT